MESRMGCARVEKRERFVAQHDGPILEPFRGAPPKGWLSERRGRKGTNVAFLYP